MTLPLSGHRGGRAAPLPAPAPQAPAAPSAPEPKAAEPPRVVVPECRDADPDVSTMLTGDTGAGEVAAAAGRFRRASQLARERAEGDQAEAHRVMTEARAQVAEILRSAEAAASVLAKSAGQAARQAEALGDRSRWLVTAANETTKAEAAEDRADDLQAEREQLAASVTELDGRLAVLAAEREQLAARMAGARTVGDLDGLAALRSRDGAAADLAETLTAQRDAALARIAEIGEPDWPHDPKPPLAAALRAAETARRSARQAMNATWPERPEAVRDALRDEAVATLDALRDSAAEAAARQPRTFVRL